MILTRQGNKRKLFEKIKGYIPEHEIYIEPFFGTGSIFFMKERVKHNLLNDLDEEVFNLFQVIKNKPVELKRLLLIVPKHKAQFDFWKKNCEKSDLWRAVRFLYLSNLSYMASGSTFTMKLGNTKYLTISRIKKVFDSLMDTVFSNQSYDVFIRNLSLKDKKGKNKIFIYCDPPYVKTAQRYNTPKWGIADFEKLIEFLMEDGEKFMVSEFENPEVIKIAEKNKLNIIKIGDRINLKNRRTEIIIKNY